MWCFWRYFICNSGGTGMKFLNQIKCTIVVKIYQFSLLTFLTNPTKHLWMKPLSVKAWIRRNICHTEKLFSCLCVNIYFIFPFKWNCANVFNIKVLGYFQSNLVICLPRWFKFYNTWIRRLLTFYVYLQYFSRNVYEQEHFYYMRAPSVLGVFLAGGHVS